MYSYDLPKLQFGPGERKANRFVENCGQDSNVVAEIIPSCARALCKLKRETPPKMIGEANDGTEALEFINKTDPYRAAGSSNAQHEWPGSPTGFKTN